METARGRWFLLEYARRLRAAETKELLDAIERLERRLHAAPPAQQDPRLAALSRLDHLSPEQKLSLFA